MLEAISRQLSAVSPKAEETIPPHRYVTVAVAARHVGLSRKAIKRAISDGRLSGLHDRGRTVVRLRDVNECDLGAGWDAGA